MIEKYCDEDCDYWKGLWWLKKVVMIEKDYDNWKRLWLKKFMLVIGRILVVMLFFFTKRICTHQKH